MFHATGMVQVRGNVGEKRQRGHEVIKISDITLIRWEIISRLKAM